MKEWSRLAPDRPIDALHSTRRGTPPFPSHQMATLIKRSTAPSEAPRVDLERPSTRPTVCWPAVPSPLQVQDSLQCFIIIPVRTFHTNMTERLTLGWQGFLSW
ncbi:hypothetical protein NMY22_g20147 [Coprinellus aureogranulatus]|nr:hypothetical protein NMY22_g20147 [Coprinellus aureogranulatus]